jgi:predicted NAD/FAD-dependent oxidoreductase
MFGSVIEISLAGLMLLWGDDRTSAFTDPPAPRSNRGDTVFKGGTNELTKKLAAVSGATITSGARVRRVERTHGGYRVTIERGGRLETVMARQIVCALPAPVALGVLADLPEAKREALATIRYGCNIATPISIAPAGTPVQPIELVPSRPDQIYNANGFVLKTPGDMERDGGCFHSYVYDVFARALWDDPPETVKSGAVRALLARYPQYEGRIARVGFARWPYALPHYRPGRMAMQKALEASVDGIHFCGDYVVTANMDGAVRSAEAAVGRVLDNRGG